MASSPNSIDAVPPPQLILSDTLYPRATTPHLSSVAHFLSTDGRRLVIARAAGDQVVVLDGRYQPIQTLDFAQAFERNELQSKDAAREDGKQASITCIRVKEGSDGNVLIIAAAGDRVAIWSATVHSSATKRWHVHSTIRAFSYITSMDLYANRLLIGSGSVLELWTLPIETSAAGSSSAGLYWRKQWEKKAPGVIRDCAFSPYGGSFAACCKQDRRVIVWSIGKGREATPIRTSVLPHAGTVQEMRWRGLPDTASQSEVLITRSTDGAARIWAPVLDQPSALRLSATIDAHSFGKATSSNGAKTKADESSPVICLDAGSMAALLRSNIALVERDLQMAEVGLGGSNTVRETDMKRTRLKRLQHLLSDTPDMFLLLQPDGSLVMRAVANLDRRPPTLLQAFTVLKLSSPLALRPDQVTSVEVIPFYVDNAQDSEAALGTFHFRKVDGTSLDVEINLALFFDGQAAALASLNACRTGYMRRIEHISASDGDDAVLLRDATNQTLRLSTRRVRMVGTGSSRKRIALACEEETGLLSHGGSPAASSSAASKSRLYSTSRFRDGDAALSATIQKDEAILIEAKSSSQKGWQHRANLRSSVRDIAHVAVSSTGLVAVIGSAQQEQAVNGSNSHSRCLEIMDLKAQPFTSPSEILHRYDEILMSIDWLDPGHVVPLLAVATRHRVDVWCRGRPELSYTKHRQAWSIIASHDFSKITAQEVSAIKWTNQSALIVVVGSNVHLLGPLISSAQVDEEPIHLLELAASRSGPLPPYHPNALMQWMQWDKLEVVEEVLSSLAARIKELGEGEVLKAPSIPTPKPQDIVKNTAPSQSEKEGLFAAEDGTEQALDQETALWLCEQLPSIKLEGLVEQDVTSLTSLVKTYLEATKIRATMDTNALRYLVAWDMFRRRPTTSSKPVSTSNRYGPVDALSKTVTVEAPERLRMSDVVSAFHCSSQETLLSAIEAAYGIKLSWSTARSLGLFLWLSNSSTSSPAASMSTIAEQVARNEYLSTSDRDPIRCSLFYFALGKLQIVKNLWKQAAGHNQQKKMLTFLANDFSETRWKQAACKNAFALISQRRFEFAASFFMLGDSLEDAVNVCVRNLKDLELAIALVRIKEGRDNGPVLRKLIMTKVLPGVFEEGDRWMAHWCFWTLGMRDLAQRVLVTPLSVIASDSALASLSLPASLSGVVASYEDISLPLLYAHLKSTGGSTGISPQHETDFLLYSARTLSRMGCDAIAATLLATWDFTAPLAVQQAEVEQTESSIPSAVIDKELVSPAKAANGTESTVRTKTLLDEVSEPSLNNDSDAISKAPAALPSKTATSPPPVQDPEPAKTTTAKPAVKKPGISLMKANGDKGQQGAQEFDFSNFGF